MGQEFDPALLAAILRSDFASFIRKCALTLAPGIPFQDNWHIHALAWYLDQVRRGAIRRLIINMPPRSLKSVAASVALPAFALGHDPVRRIICMSYGAELSVKHANDFRAIVDGDWYRALFPSMQVSRNKNSEAEVATTRHGYRLATSIGGTLTGRGGDLIIIDDPLKPIDALSEPKRESVNQWFSNTLLSRLDNKRTGAIVIVMQRVHMEDLTGFVTRMSDDWTVLPLPAIAESDAEIVIGEGRVYRRRAGEVLQPAREPKGVLDAIKHQLGSDLFAAQYQQEPVPPGGAMIKRAWVQRYSVLPPPSSRARIVQSWDTAAKNGPDNDWSVCTTWRIEPHAYYLLDVHRARHDYPSLKARALTLAERHRPWSILIEDAGTGTALIAELRRLGRVVIAVRPEHDKITRMSVQSAKFEAGQVYLPERAPWLADFEAELFAFPNGRHDDQVDSVSQALGRPAFSIYDFL
jgi:predicted phage terminase large subunit-like protein